MHQKQQQECTINDSLEACPKGFLQLFCQFTKTTFNEGVFE